MRSTFSRSFYPFVIILLAALIFVGIFFLNLAERVLEQQTVRQLKNNCTVISQLAESYLAAEDPEDRDFYINLSVAAQTAQADAVICDAEGVLRVCSHAPFGCEHQGLVITDAAFLQKLEQEEFLVSTGLVEGLYQEARFVVATAVRGSQTDARQGIVIVSIPITRSMLALTRLQEHYLMVSVTAILIAVVLLILFVRKNNIPLRDMAKAATAFGHGDLQVRTQVPESAPVEIRELSLAFNNMAQSLEKSELQRREFVANISHELKTPMTTISGYVDGILDGTIPQDQQEKYLKIVSEETKRLSRLVRSMLDISRDQEIPEETKTKFDLTECIGQVLVSFEPKITGKKLDVRVELPRYPVYTLASWDHITQVIYNLLDNAVKFCPEGGLLQVKVTTGGNKIYCSLANSGETIPAEELPLLFERFHKVDKSRNRQEGWGLGLYIVKTIICGHGEDISVTSKDGMTEFTFTLPLSN